MNSLEQKVIEELEALDNDSLLDHFGFVCMKYANDLAWYRYLQKVKGVILQRLANKNDPSANGPSVENTYQP
ncbi:hypothetical protein [Brevibacillus laterosporus]|uniref:hypothetical protein n=1 Tax=Brevibacillus laterosporus TaxID=1465 RepID=UPI003D25894A